MRAHVACLLFNVLAATTLLNSLTVLANGATAEANSDSVEHLHYSSTVIKLDAFALNSKSGRTSEYGPITD